MKLDLVTGAVSSNNEFEKLPIDYQPDGPEMIPPEEEQEEERGLPGFPRKSPTVLISRLNKRGLQSDVIVKSKHGLRMCPSRRFQ